MVKSKEELLSAIKEIAGENITSDAAIALIEDLSDTLDERVDESALRAEIEQAQAEAQRIDAEWRQKYTERFFTGKDPEEDPEDPEEEPEDKIYKYEDLFVEEKKEEE